MVNWFSKEAIRERKEHNKKNKMRDLGILGVFIFILLMVLGVWENRNLNRWTERLQRWDKVNGILQKNISVTEARYDGKRIRKSKKSNVEYTFSYRGKQYLGKTIVYDFQFLPTAPPAGSVCQVLVNPEKPIECALLVSGREYEEMLANKRYEEFVWAFFSLVLGLIFFGLHKYIHSKNKCMPLNRDGEKKDMMNNIFLLVFGTMLLLGSGCANHLRNIDTLTQETERKVLGIKYEMKISPESMRDTAYHVEIEKLESADVKKFEVHTVKNLATPYQWWREFYEIPAGIGLLPVSIGSHLLFLCSFGMFPYDIPKSINELSFTGMNPFLNWESDERTEENLVLMDKRMLSQGNENIRKPLAQSNILIQAGELSRTYKTDDFGGFALNFLALRSEDTFFPLSRKVVFCLESDKSREIKHYILTRDFLAKLLRARSKINTYSAHPSGKQLFETVIYLEKMGFEQLAYSLEESELQKNKSNKKFQADFQTASQE